MSETKFTPGPWEIKKVQDVVFVAAKPFRGHPYFGVSTTVEIMSDEDYPTKFYDAALISAAPELYEALEGLRNLTDPKREGSMILSRADHKPMTNGDQDIIDHAYLAAEAAIRKARGEAS